ncbi:helix-turn-helix domain-containing protein, partial [Nocardia farcinica]
STGVPSRQRANAGLDQNPVTSSIIFREGAPSRDPQVLIIAPPSSPGPSVPGRHDEHRVGTFIWPPAGTSTWPPVGTFSWPWTLTDNISAADEEPGPAPLPLDVAGASSDALRRHLSPLERAECAVIARTLNACGGNKAATAEQLEITRGTLYHKLAKYRLS